MIQTTTIETNKAERLMKALCNHFARKIKAGYEGDRGYVQFQDGICELTATSDALNLQVQAGNAEQLSRLKGVVVDHLLRFTLGKTFKLTGEILSADCVCIVRFV
jgi:hypothetical protein